MAELRHAVGVQYYSDGSVKYGNYKPDGIAEGSLRPLDKLEMFKLLSLIVWNMQKDPEVATDIQKTQNEARERDENSLQWHRYIENQNFIESGKMSSSSAHVSNHVSAEEEYAKKTKLWTPQGEVEITNKLLKEIQE